MRPARSARIGAWPGVALAALLMLAAPALVRAQTGPAGGGGSSCWHLGESVVVAGGETLGCNLVVVGGDVTVESDAVVDGDVAVPFGRAEIFGEVAGDAYASAGLRLGASALVRGDASSLGTLEMADGARVAGRVDRLGGRPGAAASGLDAAELASALSALLVLAVLAAITAALFIHVAGEIVEVTARAGLGSARRVLASLAVGAVAGVAGTLLAVVALLTIFLPLVVGALLVGAAAIGSAALALRAGDRLVPRAGPSARAALGAAVLIALAFAPLVSGRLGLFVLGLAVDLAVLALVLGTGVLGAIEAMRRRAEGGAWPAPTAAAPRAAALPRAAPEAEAAPLDGPWSAAGIPDPTIGSEAEPVRPIAEHAVEPGPAPVDPWPAAGPGPAIGTADAKRAGAPNVPSGTGEAAALEPADDAALDLAPYGETAHVAPEPVAEADPPAAPAPGDEAAFESPRPAAVRELEGMTPIYAHLLAGAGFATLDDLAQASVEAVLRALSVPGIRPVGEARAAAWINAARARGDAPA